MDAFKFVKCAGDRYGEIIENRIPKTASGVDVKLRSRHMRHSNCIFRAHTRYTAYANRVIQFDRITICVRVSHLPIIRCMVLRVFVSGWHVRFYGSVYYNRHRAISSDKNIDGIHAFNSLSVDAFFCCRPIWFVIDCMASMTRCMYVCACARSRLIAVCESTDSCHDWVLRRIFDHHYNKPIEILFICLHRFDTRTTFDTKKKYRKPGARVLL